MQSTPHSALSDLMYPHPFLEKGPDNQNDLEYRQLENQPCDSRVDPVISATRTEMILFNFVGGESN